MIKIKKTIEIEIEIIDASKAIERESTIGNLLIKVPFINLFIIKKVQKTISDEIMNRLSGHNLSKQIATELLKQGVEAKVHAKSY